MRVISVEEHQELMAFLSDKARQLYAHEVRMAIQRGNPPKDVYQGIFNIKQCCAFEKGKVIYYLVYTRSFLNLIRKFIPELTKEDPNVFMTKDAYYILERLNNISGYSNFKKSTSDFLNYISGEVCVYIAAKCESEFDEKVLRIDLCRGVLPSRKDANFREFYGGLLHAAKHFRIDESMTVDSSYDLERLMSLSMYAFTKIVPDEYKSIYSICLPYDDNYSLQFCFYQEKHTNVYYINTIYPIHNSHLETFFSKGKYGLRYQKGGVLVPCVYDEIVFNAFAKCYFCKRDGAYDKDWYTIPSYSGVIDLYSERGELLVGGFNDYYCDYDTGLFFLTFGERKIVLDRDMQTVWDRTSFKGRTLSEKDIPERFSFLKYKILNHNQVALTQEEVYLDFFTRIPYRIVFLDKHTISEEYDWFYPLSDEVALCKGSWDLLGVISGRQATKVVYDYISKPYRGWCIGIAHEGCEHDKISHSKDGYCVLINTCSICSEPIVLYRHMSFFALEEYVKNGWALMCDVDDAADCVGVLPKITIPEQLFNSNVVNPSLKENLVCGPSIKGALNAIVYVSARCISKDKEEYIDRVYPKPNYFKFSGYVSPLDAFEGDEEIYNDWLISQ